MKRFSTKSRTILVMRMKNWGLECVRVGQKKPFTWMCDIGPFHVLVSPKSPKLNRGINK
jgi:hypothetical protein